MNDFDFDGLQNEMVADSANELLDRHLDRARQWCAVRGGQGSEPTLKDLIMQLDGEPSKRKHIIAAYSAALWRLIHKEGN